MLPEQPQAPPPSSTEDVEQPSGGAPPSGSAALPATQVLPPMPDAAGGVAVIAPEPKEDGGKPLGADAPSLAGLQNQLCPNCATGVLYVTRYDPDALHEQGQDYSAGLTPPALPRGFESGGAYEVRCASCDWSNSVALNPGQYHGRAR